ncbi:MAG: sigma-70 family RNA polymerase sigma factor [Candidatus Omnitrophica bacterium]|nr:sigma-70 family RNA polymerase sigma factor [Candidatus Omnitrophota bacterium]
MTDFKVSPSDGDLLNKARKGNKGAFEDFYARYKRRILNYIYRMIGNRESAEDIAQETFVKAYMNLSTYTEQAKAINWIYTIAGNTCKNFLRDKKLKQQLSLDAKLLGNEKISLKDIIQAEGDTPSDLTINKEQENLVQAHINLMPLKYKEVLILCDIEGCSYEETAQILRCSVGSVGSRLSRARLILAKKLKKYFKDRG